MSNSVSVSLLGDKTYRDALNMVAKRRNIDTGALVRAALDSYIGAEITDALSFFVPHVEQIHRLANETSGEVQHA